MSPKDLQAELSLLASIDAPLPPSVRAGLTAAAAKVAELTEAITAMALGTSEPSEAAIKAATAHLYAHAQWKGDAYTAGRMVRDILATVRKVAASGGLKHGEV